VQRAGVPHVLQVGSRARKEAAVFAAKHLASSHATLARHQRAMIATL
jgi:hypothetical protein